MPPSIVERPPGPPADQLERQNAASSGERGVAPNPGPDPRFLFANDRTYLAWTRTGLALISGGLAVTQFVRFGFGGARLLVGLPLIALGVLMAIRSYQLWQRNEQALRDGQSLSSSPLPRVLVAGVIGVAAIATALIILQFAFA